MLLALRASQLGARMPHEVMTIKEVVALPEFTVKAYATPLAGEIPDVESSARSPIRGTEFDQGADARPRGGDGGGRGE